MSFELWSKFHSRSLITWLACAMIWKYEKLFIFPNSLSLVLSISCVYPRIQNYFIKVGKRECIYLLYTLRYPTIVSSVTPYYVIIFLPVWSVCLPYLIVSSTRPRLYLFWSPPYPQCLEQHLECNKHPDAISLRPVSIARDWCNTIRT